MSEKYYLKKISFAFYYNAANKAVDDVNQILESNDYKSIPIYSFEKKLSGIFGVVHAFLRLFFTLRKGDELFIQIPFYFYFAKYLYRYLLSIKGISIDILVHDVNSLRGMQRNREVEISLLKRARRVIVHTPKMKQLLVDFGVAEHKVEILYLFDYLVKNGSKKPSEYGKSILFAGNLNKSSFLGDANKCRDVNFVVYGLESSVSLQQENVVYKGVFLPEDIENIEGDWGLVWDGDSVESCVGVYGEYLKINSSHKASLYIACNKPIIVWEGAALKDFVLENHLGFAVNSLLEISERIDGLKDDEFSAIRKGVSIFSEKVRSGAMLGSHF